LLDVGRIDHEIGVVQKSRVQIHSAHARSQVDEKQPPPFGRSQQTNFTRDERHALLKRIEVRIEDNNVHPLFTHTSQSLNHILCYEDVIFLLCQRASD